MLRLDLVHEVFLVLLFVIALFGFLVGVVPNSSTLWENVRCVMHPIGEGRIGQVADWDAIEFRVLDVI